MTDQNYSSIVGKLSAQIGTTEPALKLLITVFAGYPLALFYRKYIYNKAAIVQHLYFILSGFSLGFWNYGMDMFHCIFAICFNFFTLSILKGSSLAVAVAFIFNLGYLLIGYTFTSTNEYDINWTMPFCILVLRLTAVAYDLYDGQQSEDTLSTANKKVILKETPSTFEFLGHSLFPASFLVGPQFSMKRYKDFVSGEFSGKDDKGNNLLSKSLEPGLKKLLLGVGYLITFQVLGIFVSDNLMCSEDFGNMNFFKRMLYLGLWGRFTLYKYISCWLLTEGACILFGLSYNGKNENGEVSWNGVENVKLAVFENTQEFNHYIQSFNINTNHWVAQYVYKRLKFLGNRHISQLAALLFLAVWHGFHSGYYVCFFFEFAIIYMERDIKSIVNSNAACQQFFDNSTVKSIRHILLRIYTFVFMGWCLLPFALLNYERYWKSFTNVSCIGIVLFVMWPIIYSPVLKYLLSTKRHRD